MIFLISGSFTCLNFSRIAAASSEVIRFFFPFNRRFDHIRERIQNRFTKQAAESHPLKGIDQSVRNILLTFNNCIVLLYRQWVADGRKIPMEKMIELATTLLEKGMKGFRNK